jgi:hypothetical protein
MNIKNIPGAQDTSHFEPPIYQVAMVMACGSGRSSWLSFCTHSLVIVCNHLEEKNGRYF